MQTNHIKNIAIVGAGAMGAAYASMFADALPAIQAVTGPETTILSVMNGLESEEIIGAACGKKIVYAIAIGIDAVREGDSFTYARPGRIIFGEGPQKGDSSRIARLHEALNQAAIPHEVPADMLRVMWWKFMINVDINQASAVLGAPYGNFHHSTDAQALMLQLMREVIALAEKLAVDLSEKDIEVTCHEQPGWLCRQIKKMW